MDRGGSGKEVGSMSQKPVHLRGKFRGRERMWELMRKLRRFSIKEIAEKTAGYDPSTVRHYANSLVAGGYLQKHEPSGRWKPAIYEIVKDSPYAPRVRADGSPVTQGQGREQMWRSMRILKSFSANDLVAASSTEEHRVSPEEAKTYLRYLVRAGYVRKTGKNYVFIKYTGPRPPQIQRIHQVWDPNIRKVVWTQHADK